MFDNAFLREIADNWMLVSMFTFFVGAILWAFRPGSRAVHQETANIPFRNEDFPASAKNGLPSQYEEQQP